MEHITKEILFQLFGNKPFLVKINFRAGLETLGFLAEKFEDNALIEVKFVNGELRGKAFNYQYGLFEYGIRIDLKNIEFFYDINKIEKLAKA